MKQPCSCEPPLPPPSRNKPRIYEPTQHLRTAAISQPTEQLRTLVLNEQTQHLRTNPSATSQRLRTNATNEPTQQLRITGIKEPTYQLGMKPATTNHHQQRTNAASSNHRLQWSHRNTQPLVVQAIYGHISRLGGHHFSKELF